MPVRYIERANRIAAERGTTPYQYTVHAAAPPLASLAKPLAQCRVALITSGGVHHVRQEPFEERDDTTFRELPKDVPLNELRIRHGGYNHADADRDPNCVLPLTVMRQMEAEGVIGALASPVFSFMGRVPSRLRLMQETAPGLAKRLRAADVDACLLVPA